MRARYSGAIDTLPHNGPVVTLLSVSRLTHRQSYSDIVAVALIKSAALFVVISTDSLTGIV